MITGIKGRRIKSMLLNNINLLAYHLPIDIHPSLGNNAQLGRLLGFKSLQAHPNLSPSGIVMSGEFEQAIQASELTSMLSGVLEREVLHISASNNKVIKRVAWCTGGGQGYIDACAQQGFDAFISGEISEQTTHSARELNIHYFAAGHHATERYGVKALGEHINSITGIEVEFVDVPNPA